jgi:tetratricopeptide (TPR) repeat protein
MCDMTDNLYERYKESLRTGHVAVLRGSLPEALTAYQVAAEIAPSRALPHTSMGGVYLRLGRLEDALTEFASAVARAPNDEGALFGQAEALTASGMPGDAAAALDRVAEIQEASGRLPEAADTLRRAVELEEAPERIRRQRALLREIRFSSGDHAAEQLLARALRLRDEPASEVARPAAGWAITPDPASEAEPAAAPVPETPYRDFGHGPVTPPYIFDRKAAPVIEAAAADVPAGTPVPGPSDAAPVIEAAEPEPVVAAPVATEPEPVAADIVATEPETASGVAAEPGPASPERSLVPAAGAAPESEQPPASAEPERVGVAEFVGSALVRSDKRPSVGVMESVDNPPLIAPLVGGSDHQPAGDELMTAADAAEVAGDFTTLRSLLLWTARAYAREGRFEAALDTTHRLLQRTPSDVDAHLVLVEIYVARSWDGLAAEKLKLLGRLAELNNDQETRQRLCEAATRAFPEDPTLEHLCA